VKLRDLTGQRFGRLTVIERAMNSPHGMTKWLCKCDCGAEIIARRGNLHTGNTQSCGCWRRDSATAGHIIHGEGKRYQTTAEYRCWRNMITRCRNPHNHAFKNYGGRGISICDEWLDFKCFLADMGRRPSTGFSLDRINNDGNYEPGNCRWATRKQQANNKRPQSHAHI
jgi:hypothetical protein